MAKQRPHGVIDNPLLPDRRTDYLFRVSLKSIIRNNTGEVLVVKEGIRDSWDLPGGGIDHGEDIKSSLTRELKEEVNLEGDFDYRVIHIDEPMYLERHGFWLLRLILAVDAQNLTFSPGIDSEEVAFIHPDTFKDSDSEVERRIYNYINSL